LQLVSAAQLPETTDLSFGAGHRGEKSDECRLS